MMMSFDEMRFCGDMNFFSAPLGDADMAVQPSEPEATVEDDYTDEEMDIDELERRLWKDKMRLKRLKEQNRGKEGIDMAKQCQSQEQANRGKEGIDIAKQRRSQEQARRKKMAAPCQGPLKRKIYRGKVRIHG